MHFSLVAFALLLLTKAVQVQLVERDSWGKKAEQQQIREEAIAPFRGRILDATGRVLVETRELKRVTINPHELRVRKQLGDTRLLVRDAMRALRVPQAVVRRAMDTTRRWVP